MKRFWGAVIGFGGINSPSLPPPRIALMLYTHKKYPWTFSIVDVQQLLLYPNRVYGSYKNLFSTTLYILQPIFYIEPRHQSGYNVYLIWRIVQQHIEYWSAVIKREMQPWHKSTFPHKKSSFYSTHFKRSKDYI